MFDLAGLNIGEVSIAHARHGTFAIIKSDNSGPGALLNYYGEFAEHEIRLLCALVDHKDFVIEVGCNIGTHSIPFARHLASKGRFIAYEAQPMIAALLRVNLALNGLTNAETRMCAAGASVGYCEMPLIDYANAPNTGAISLLTGQSSCARLPIEPLDLIERSQKVNLIKIDVEGMEIDVLRGAQTIIKNDRPFVYFEHEYVGSARSLQSIEFFEDKNYKLFWDVKLAHNEQNFNGREAPYFSNIGSSSNILAVPAERLDGLTKILTAMKLTPIDDPTQIPEASAP